MLPAISGPTRIRHTRHYVRLLICGKKQAVQLTGWRAKRWKSRCPDNIETGEAGSLW